ncbi:long-chain-fatty-acid--CoA ligase [Mycolicibacterium sp. P9-64]|uniref:long-chain-fatty-acid--CoA ligase n=1 Tax=Mycolicibacterium sp. P9-64 TaxID=2024612 RepID=UPI001564668D|nr:long-chain-fatty-acid--CoA ligase [Mycolicibacterium sp. P9-64]
MQDAPLTLDRLIRRMRDVTASAQAIGPTSHGALRRMSFGDIAADARRIGGLLESMGIVAGDRVASLAFNTIDHLTLFLGVPAHGVVLQTVNPRFTAEQIEYVLGHGGARVLFVQQALLELVVPALSRLPALQHVLVIDRDVPDDEYRSLADALVSAEPREPVLTDERIASGLCYTSGTTGSPKGVLYSHRSTFLHALSACMTDVMAVSGHDTILPIVPMFHANAWGLPHAAALVGAHLILPGRDLSGAAVGELIRRCGVTMTAGVPTVLDDLLAHADNNHGVLDTLRTVISGGSALQRPMVDGFSRHGVEVIQGWGMTETSPCVTMSRPPRDAEDPVGYRLSAGRLNPLVEARLIDEDNHVLAPDGTAVGEIELNSPHAAAAYYRADELSKEKFDDGWLRTGDAASITPDGYVILRDRIKDMIKSGGEWIPSARLESVAAEHPAVREVAVIAVHDERWGERPGAVVALRPGHALSLDDLREFMSTHVPKWWLPVALSEVVTLPKTSVGKIDKKALRVTTPSHSRDATPVDGVGP